MDGPRLIFVRSFAKSASCRALTDRPCFYPWRNPGFVVTTLGTGQDEQIIDALEGEYRSNFMLHYNFPPILVARPDVWAHQVGAKSATASWLSARLIRCCRAKRRFLIRFGSLKSPNPTAHPPMATVCGSSLSMMDAVYRCNRWRASLWGLIKEGEKFAVLVRYSGDEDHLGGHGFQGGRNGNPELRLCKWTSRSRSPKRS